MPPDHNLQLALHHRRRQHLFALLDRATKAAVVALGISLLTIAPQLAPWIGAAIASLMLLALVFAYDDRVQVHGEWAEAHMRRYLDARRSAP